MTKYRAKPTVVDGIRFASKKEATRFSELMLLEKAGAISGLECQPRYGLHVRNRLIATYVADFRYLDEKTGAMIIEDCKGMRTPVYKIKKKLFEAIYERKILET